MSTLELCIFGVIGDARRGTVASEVVARLKATAADELVVRISSTGGDVYQAAAMFNAIRAYPARAKTTRIEICADSAASWLAFAAEKVLIAPDASMTIHRPSSLSATRESLDAMTTAIATIYETKTGAPASKWLAMMDAVTRFDATAAIAAGLADETTANKEIR